MVRKMSDDHKDALAKGRVQGKIVRDYLEALEQGRKPGRKLDKETIEQRIPQVQEQIENETDPAKRLELVQRRLDLEARLVNLGGDGESLETLEEEFVKIAKEYADRRGISYTAWRELGVPPQVMKRTGIQRTRRPNQS